MPLLSMKCLCLFVFLHHLLILHCFIPSLGLEIGKFFFCKKEELINTLQSNKVKLFLSTERDDVHEAQHTGRSLHEHLMSHFKIFLMHDLKKKKIALIHIILCLHILLSLGIPAALLYDQADDHVLNQLKVIFSGDVIGFSEDSLSDFGFSETQIETLKAAKVNYEIFVFMQQSFFFLL